MQMANNLDEMISQSGMSKKALAEEKGVTPETVSRHIHSKISMTLQDVDDYARILKCKPHEIAYNSAPLPIVGAWRSCEQTGNPKCASRFSIYPEYFKKGVLIHGQFDGDYAAVVWELNDSYRGRSFHLNGCVHLVDITAVDKCVIDRRSLMCLSYAMTKNGTLISGILWPQPQNDKFTMTNMMGVEDTKKQTRTDLDLLWASPVMETKFHRSGDLKKVVDYESPFVAKHHAKIIMPQTAARRKEYADIYDIVPEAKAGQPHRLHLEEVTKDAPKVIHDDATGEVIHIKD